VVDAPGRGGVEVGIEEKLHLAANLGRPGFRRTRPVAPGERS
jgi:hypothetical protein